MLGAVKTGRPSARIRTPFGERLYAARINAGLSQAQVAEKMGVTQKAYSFWERRTVALRPDQIEKLVQVLNISANDLFTPPPPRKRPVSKAK